MFVFLVSSAAAPDRNSAQLCCGKRGGVRQLRLKKAARQLMPTRGNQTFFIPPGNALARFREGGGGGMSGLIGLFCHVGQ